MDKMKLDVDSLAKTITHSATKTKSLFSSARIYKLPKEFRKPNECAYTPQVIAIGPLHNGNEQLPKMEDVKIYYTYYLLARLAEGVEDKVKKIRGVLQECATKMEECVHKTKECYAEELTVDNHDIAKMMLFDGCFILELLYATYAKKTKEAGKGTTNGGDSGNSKASSSSDQQPASELEDDGSSNKLDPILDNFLIASIIKHDMLLFENQIPFFVLEDLFELTLDKIPGDKIPGGKKLSLPEYIESYFCDILFPKGKSRGSEKETSCCSPSDCVVWVCGSAKENEQKEKEPGENEQYDHILHLLHDYYGPGDQSVGKAPCALPCTIALPCRTKPKKFSALEVRASELERGGVKFVPFEGNNLFHVKFSEPPGICWWFHRATFQIPTLNMHDSTESFLRNLIAFEQFRPEVPRYFTTYANLMDMLINSEKDVEVLNKANVICNFSGTDEDVSKLLNMLCKEVVAGFVFDDTMQKAFEYSQRCWPRYMAYWRRTYVASPWAFRGFFVALIAFVIQIINFARSF